MKTRIMIVILSIAILTLCISPAIVQAYSISTFYVQQRYYEDKAEGPNGNGQLVRVWFDIINSDNKFITKDLLTSISLYDPNGSKVDDVSLDKILFVSSYNEVDGSYDGTMGRWKYNNPYSTTGYYTAFEKGTNLIKGTYRLSIVYDGETVETTFDFVGKVTLPYVLAKTISYHLDSKGNLIATWDISDNLLTTFPSVGIHARAIIDVYKAVYKKGVKTKDKYLYCLNVRIPLAGGRLYVPKAVVTAMKASASKRFVYLFIQVRTNDSCNRSVSKSVELTNLE